MKRESRPRAFLGNDVVTNKVPVQPSEVPPVAPPPIVLPGGQVRAARLDAAPETSRTAADVVKELGAWPDEKEFSGRCESDARRTTESRLDALRPPVQLDRETLPGAETEPSFPAVGFEIEAGPHASLPPTEALCDESLADSDAGHEYSRPRLPPEIRPGRPWIELRVPTGWSKSVGDGDLKRRKAQATPDPVDSGPESGGERSRLSSAQFLLVTAIITLLNTPLLIVGWDYLGERFGRAPETIPDALSLEDLVAIELALEADPAGGEAILAEHSLDRHQWSELRASVTADPKRNAEFEAIRQRRDSP